MQTLAVLLFTLAAAPSPLHVKGNQLLNQQNKVVRLRGVNVASLEWGDGEPNPWSSPASCWSGQTIHDRVWEALNRWHANFIRLPVSQDRWWSALANDGQAYRKTVDDIVNTVTAAGGYVDIDLHWSNAGQWGKNVGQHFMPDDNTTTVIDDIAGRYANNPAVLIGVYNEPHDVDWNTWLRGGQVREGNFSYHTPGMQALVNAVRRHGNNVAIVGGLDWAFDLTGLHTGHAVHDGNLVYDAHVYPFKGMVDYWDQKVSVVANEVPVLIGEFGAYAAGDAQNKPWANPADYMNHLSGWLEAHQYSYSAWDFAPVAPPVLLADWCYTPTGYFGAAVQDWLKH